MESVNLSISNFIMMQGGVSKADTSTKKENLAPVCKLENTFWHMAPKAH